METNYDVTDAVGRIDSSTEKLNNLDLAVKYNQAIWQVPYLKHLFFMSTLNTIGDISALSNLEALKYTQADHLGSINFEIGNFAVEDWNEHQMVNRVIT